MSQKEEDDRADIPPHANFISNYVRTIQGIAIYNFYALPKACTLNDYEILWRS